MKEYILIPAEDFCLSHQIELEIIQAFGAFGLIEIVTEKEMLFIPETQIEKLERILVFNKELHINMEGIETIFDLLERIEKMQDLIIQLENRLQRFHSLTE